jgi:hypothetical protein
MSEPRGRREGQPLKTRTRQRPDQDDYLEDRRDVEPPPLTAPLPEDEGFTGGFDAETNSRYEEIKRGTTFISQLQQMTMPILLKTAR